MKVELTAEEKISKGIIVLQKPQPFFAYLMMHLRPKLMPESAKMQTVGVNAKGELFYSREYVQSLSMDEVMGVLCHEVLHVALLHPLRTGSRNREIANIAQDVVVNMMVAKACQATASDVNMKIPSGSIPADIYRDMSVFQLAGVQIRIEKVSEKAWEEVYAEIIEKLQQSGKDTSSASRSGLGFDDHMEGEGEDMSQQEQREAEQKWMNALADAATYAKQQGKLPAGMDRIIDCVLKPRVRWKSLLLKYLRPHINPVDWSYHRPHRKSQVLEVYMPNVKRERCEVEVVVDTSGSIGKGELQEFLSEIVAIAKSMQHLRMWVTFFDANEQGRYEVDNGEIPKILAMKPRGGGGTDMERCLDGIKERNREIPCAIVLTDGCTDFNRKAKDYPFDVIWVITKNGIRKKVPYGVTVKMD